MNIINIANFPKEFDYSHTIHLKSFGEKGILL